MIVTFIACLQTSSSPLKKATDFRQMDSLELLSALREILFNDTLS